MSKKIYFGTRERMTWVNAPAIDVDLSRGRWMSEGVYLNGGAYVRASLSGHKRYGFSWNMASQKDIYDVVDYADGLYGEGLIYFLEPFAQTTNCLPQFWASPRLAQADAPSLVVGSRPTLLDTATNTFGYPTKSAVYTIAADSTVETVWIPVPVGYTLHFGAHGSSTGTAAVTLLEDGGVTPTSVVLLSTTTSALTNTTFADAGGVTLSVGGVGQLTLAGMVAQVLPTGTSPSTGDFISGRGHSGCRFGEPPTVTGYSSAIDKVSASALLIETGAWENI